MKKGRVYLTGGGCGDAGLLTLKALEALQNCDTVIYDSLVSEELLEWTRDDCEKIYVGKRYGRHAMKQPEINTLLVKKAQEGKTVVRLKGGDPYVFGRGGEEFLALEKAGVSCEEIPGISSAIAVPAAAGIPVTHRGLAASVTVVTGTAAEEDGQARLKLDFDILARLDGTLVILMGMHHLEEIAKGLQSAGKSPDTPCAIIMEGTTGRQRCMRTVLSSLSEEASAQGFTSPAVIVVGAVADLELLSGQNDVEAGLRDECVEDDKAKLELRLAFDAGIQAKSGWGVKMDKKQLSGITVGVTGTPHFAAKMSAAIEEKGASVWDMSFMEIRPSVSPLPKLQEYDWLVFTSPNGVHVFLDKMKKEKRDFRTLQRNRIAVIGPGTEAAFAEHGVYADYMPQIYDAAHLAEGLTEKILEEAKPQGGQENKISAIFLRAQKGSDQLPLIFTQKGVPFEEYPLYELGIQEEKRAISVTKKPEYIVFGSALGVRAYFEGIKQAGILNAASRFVCIGEQCGEELRKHTANGFLVAGEASVEAIVECLCRDIINHEICFDG